MVATRNAARREESCYGLRFSTSWLQWFRSTMFRPAQLEDGTPADPAAFRSAPSVTWKVGDTIPLGGSALRVIDVRPASEPDDEPVLIVETT